MTISFLIVNRNGGEVFKRCIQSILENTADAQIADFEIIVIDNASTEDISWLKKIPHCRIIENKKNLFFSKPTNTSVQASKGDILFLLNNDIFLQKGSLGILMKELSNPSVDAVVPRLEYPDGRLQRSITGIPTWKDILFVALGLHIFFPQKDRWRKSTYDYSKKHIVTDQPMFSALVLKRKTWNSVGLLDEQLPLLWNDVDWFYRFHEKKLTCIFVPNAQVTHVHGMSVNKLMWNKLYLLSQGCFIFLTKHSKNRSSVFKAFIALICTITFFERIPVEILLRLRSLNK